MKANEKRLSETAHPDRDEQFEFLEKLIADYLAAGQPINSVDSYTPPGFPDRGTERAVESIRKQLLLVPQRS